jgi:hypothetical protein
MSINLDKLESRRKLARFARHALSIIHCRPPLHATGRISRRLTPQRSLHVVLRTMNVALFGEVMRVVLLNATVT